MRIIEESSEDMTRYSETCVRLDDAKYNGVGVWTVPFENCNGEIAWNVEGEFMVRKVAW
jgi:hypothetical protein